MTKHQYLTGPIITIITSLAYSWLVTQYGIAPSVVVFTAFIVLAGYYSGVIGAAIAAAWAGLLVWYLRSWVIDAFFVQAMIGIGATIGAIWLIYHKPQLNGAAKRMMSVLTTVDQLRECLEDETSSDTNKVKLALELVDRLRHNTGNLSTIWWGWLQLRREMDNISSQLDRAGKENL